MPLSAHKFFLNFNLVFILCLYLVALGADFLSPQSPFESGSTRLSYAPPTALHFNLKEGFYFYPLAPKIDPLNYQRSFIIQTSHKCHLSFFFRGDSYKVFGLISSDRHLIGSADCPQQWHLLGTDQLGRDFLSRLIYGLRPSLFTGLLGILIAFPLGVIYGAIAGYRGGTVGELMMRGVELVLSLPSLYLLVILAAILPPSLSNMQRLVLITVILSLIGWAGLARVIRGQVLSISEREYIQAARLSGSPDWKILIQQIIPQLSSYLVIAVTISFPSFILGETALSFLGMGVNQPDPSLGNILTEGRDLANLFLRPWLALGPAIILFLLTWSCNSLGDQLRDLFDPKNQTQGA
ncbi:MAG: ABC transporter permease [Candidatus Caenarcaniphilales bacterium]|nr:ABC transporter permease [Candidatus Caenarcaniphilales bacterium]